MGDCMNNVENLIEQLKDRVKEYFDKDASVPLYQGDYSEGDVDASTIHHINNKLLRLGEHMNTKTAKALADKKTQLMKQFMDMYIEEVTGKF